MKKAIILLLMVITISATYGCSNKPDNISIESSGVSATSEPSERVITLMADWPYYETIEDLVKVCDHIVIGKVEKVLPAIRINEGVNPEHEVWNNYTPSQITIEKVLMGTKTEGETIYIVQDGGTHTGVTENNKTETITVVVEDVVLLEEGCEYLLFVMGEENVGNGKPYSYYLPNPDVGYCRIADGKLVTHEGNNLFENGTSIDEAVSMIEACLSTPETTE